MYEVDFKAKKEKRACPLCDRSFIAKIVEDDGATYYECPWCKETISDKKKKKGVYFVSH